MNLSAACIDNNASVDIPSASNSCTRTVCHDCESYIAIHCSMLFLNEGLCGQSLQSVLVINITNMHAMSDWSEYYPCSCRVNIVQSRMCFTVSLFSALSPVGLPSFRNSSTMLDTQSLNNSLLEVLICSKNECVIIGDLSDLTVQIIFDAWWASMNIGSKRSNSWKNSRHAPSWQFNFYCAIEETSSPSITCIVCNRVLCLPSEHVTSSMGKHLVANAHIAKLNELTES